MPIKRIPFVPFPPNKALSMARSMGLIGAGNNIAKTQPHLGLWLYQIESFIGPREYGAIAVFTSLFWFMLVLGMFVFLSFAPVPIPGNFLAIGVLASVGMAFVSFFYVLIYPSVLVTKKVRELDKNLLFALRHLLIQVKSGIPLFDSMVSVSRASYGLVSVEFNKAVRKIGTGSKDVDALEELALRNPSVYFRRSLWQITNTIRVGADIGNTLEVIINNLSNEQRIMIRKYGAQLNPLAFMYMMFGVILPSLGISLIVSLSSFARFPVEPIMLWGIIAFLVFFKFNFLGVVKSRRPSIEVYK